MSHRKIPDKYRFAVLASDIITFRVVDGALHVLLGEVTSESSFKGWWAGIGGIVRPNETAEEAADRYLLEKAGIHNVYKEQLYTFSGLDRDPRGRVVAVAYLALASKDPQNRGEARTATKWMRLDHIPKLAYDHREMVHYALERLRAKIRYTNIAQYLLPEEFTLTELQSVYEIILGERLDKRNFRKKVLAAHTLKDMKITKKQGVMRPAALYRFASSKLALADIL